MKTYKIDTDQYTTEQITLLATYYGYRPEVYDTETPTMIPNPQSEIEYIENAFKAMADQWFAAPLIQQVNVAIEQEKRIQIDAVLNQVSATTVVETE